MGDEIADPGLTELGRWQAERVASWLSCEPVDHVLVSPKRRARETVEAVAVGRGLDLEVITDLDEVDRMARTYYPTELLATHGGDYWKAVQERRFEEIGWDPPEVFAARVTAAWTELVERRPGDHVVVGAHGGTIKVILGSIVGGKGLGNPFTIDYASLTRIEIRDGRAHILSVNELGHFDAERRERVGPMRGTEVGPSVG